MNHTVKEKLAKSLTAESVELLPYLPYILQDLWELGGTPDIITQLIKRHLDYNKNTRFLELACGKGAICVKVAKELGVKMEGVDIMPEFINYAQKKAAQYGVEDLCKFTIGEVNETVKLWRDYDAVIFSASGNILGTPQQTLAKLKKVIKKDGFIILDESYLLDGNCASIKYQNYQYLPYEKWQNLFLTNGLKEVEKVVSSDDDVTDIADRDYLNMEKRVNELIARYPENKEMFLGYLHSQANEVDDMLNALENVVWLLKA